MVSSIVNDKAKPQIEKKGGIISYQITSEEISEDATKATVKYSMEYGNGSTDNEKSKLINVDGKWKLDPGK